MTLPRRPAAWGALITVAAWAVTLTIRPWSDERVNDFGYLGAAARALLHGQLPYSRLAFEYPPLAAPLVALPGIGGTGYDQYRLGLAALTLACALAVVWGCARLARATGGDERIAIVAAALSPLLLGAVVRGHFDGAAVALLAWALVALVEGRTALGLALLGAGAMTKVFPLAAAPVALAWLGARGRTAVLRPAVALAGVLAAGAAVAVALSPSGALHALRYHFDRPPQLESTPAVAALVFGSGHASVVWSFGSHGVSGHAARLVAGALGAVGLAVVGLFAARARARGDARALVLGALASVAAFAAFGKVLSPQFAVWLVPLLALALAWRELRLAAVCALAMGLTFAEFPFRYYDLVAQRPGAVALVAVRDAAVVGVVAAAGWALRARAVASAGPVTPAPPPAAARSRSPARPPLPRPRPR